MGELAMHTAPTTGAGDRRWLSLRLRSWSHASESDHLREMADTMARGHRIRLALTPTGSAAGVVEASPRVDYVNGTSGSPVILLEGVFVEPSSRRKGVARALVADVPDWALAQGCSELASDSPLENGVAHIAHRALGFEETERVVYFRRSVHGA